MKIIYIEEKGIKSFNETPSENCLFKRWGEKREKINNPITITLHVEIDEVKYEKLKDKFKTQLPDRIFSFFGFK